ncbi:MAG: PEP-CTERM sorting domain-containing protein [Pyrinomonadaceae bacterium]|nr:PEP-CTERM sorting domain-containing protein [Pyrinomonadaceae bacterium]
MKQRPSNLGPSHLVKWVRVISVVTLFLCLSTISALADPVIVDQRNDGFPATGGFGFGASPLGQEFTPTFSGLNVVEILIGPRMLNSVGGVNIRIGSISGTIIGTSLATVDANLPPGPGGLGAVLRFDFPSLVPLVPENLYVIELYLVSGGYLPVFSDSDTYTRGRSIAFGNPVSSRDLWFREGIRATEPIPEPTTMLLLGTGLAGVGAAVRKRRKAHEREKV